MSDEMKNTEEQLSPTVEAIYEFTGGPKPKKKRNKKLIVGVVIWLFDWLIHAVIQALRNLF